MCLFVLSLPTPPPYIAGYHNNKIMCCGLWKLKATLKESALAVCQESNHSIAVFNEMINEDLVYSQFSRSLLGDETLDCAAYPEGSPACDRFFTLLFFCGILLLLILIAVMVGFCVAVYCTYHWRRQYMLVASPEKLAKTDYRKATGSLSDVSDDSGASNRKGKLLRKRMMSVFGAYKPQQQHKVADYNAAAAAVVMKRKLSLNTNNNNNNNNNNSSKVKPTIDGASASDGRSSAASTSNSTASSTVISHRDGANAV